MNARRHSQRRRAGFTLVELMVAMIAGSFVITGAYYLSSVSSSMFSEQLRRAETQMTLRTASEMLRRDIGRAGYHAMRATNELFDCTSVLGATGAQGTAVSPTPQLAVSLQPGANGPMLQLVGNFSSSEQYFVNSGGFTANALTLQTGNEGFRRSFVANNGAFLSDSFLAAFVPDISRPATPQGRMVSISDPVTARIFLRELLSVLPTPGAPVLQLATPLNVACVTGTVAVAPISSVRYAREDPAADPELARLAGVGALFAGNETRLALVRRELNMATNQPIPGTARVVLDYVDAQSGFVVEAIQDPLPLPNQPPIGPLTRLNAAAAVGAPNPQQFRSLVITLMVNSAEQQTVGAADRLSRAQAGRRLARFEVAMPNMLRNPGALP